MNSVFVIIILFILLPESAYSQNRIASRSTQLQLEAFGPAGLFSIRIDTRFAKKENGIGYSIGLGGTPLGVLGESCNRGLQLSLPVGLNYLVGKNKQLLELGVGVVPVIVGGTKIFCLPTPGSKDDFFSENITSYWYMLAGYRYQPVRKKGFTYRIFISPLLQKDFPLKLWGGASIGIRL